MLRLTLALVGLLLVPNHAWASRVEPEHGHHNTPRSLPPVEMQHLTTHESFTLRPDSGGHLDSKRLKGWKHFLRCHHTGREHPMSPHLAELLYATAHHFGDRSITVVAGYRAPKVARKKGNPKSPHKKGVACDFRIDGIATTEIRDYVRRAFHGVGVGYYPNSGFIHLDVGRSRDAFWIDYSGPGERAQYSRDPDGDLRAGLAEPARGGGEGDREAVDGIEAGDDGESEKGGASPSGRPSMIEDPGMADAVAPARTPLD